MDIREHNRIAWDKNVERGENQWTIPVSSEEIAAARQGQWEIYLTPTKPVPRAWFPDLRGRDVLCLASGGGQQGPILAAAGANVTVFDNSPKQLAQDRFVAERDGLEIVTIEGDMADLSAFPDQSFDLIVHPVSNVFIPDVRPVWAEAFRVLRHGGALLSGFDNPVIHMFDQELYERGILEVKHTLPYSDADSLSEEEKQRYLEKGEFLEFSHTLEDQIGGQIDAGFLIAGFYEDVCGEETND
ncbi:MAG: class I SAM-dependent methyltransferase, partial [Chloroflexi bacterium]|nr:class I SAM-dependent methyltransferase [Chloroflexota bacterium]